MKTKISQKFVSKKKKYVQTNLFGSPIKRDNMLDEKFKNFVDNLIEVDLSNLSRAELKQKLLEFKNEINKYI